MTIQFLLLMIMIILLCLFVFNGVDNTLTTTNYTYTSSKIPKDFDGFKILQISDLHCAKFGKNQSDIISAIKTASPDVIVITGDIINDNFEGFENVSTLLEGISDISPIYFVCGNHDMPSWEEYLELLDKMGKYGVISLDDDQIKIYRGNSQINLCGLFSYKEFDRISIDTTEFNILLYHYADQFEDVAPLNFDLILAGHTHGGMIRLPFVGGLLGNNHDLFPKYDSGMHTIGQSTQITSRGLGNNTLFRLYNPPEIVCVTLQSQTR